MEVVNRNVKNLPDFIHAASSGSSSASSGLLDHHVTNHKKLRENSETNRRKTFIQPKQPKLPSMEFNFEMTERPPSQQQFVSMVEPMGIRPSKIGIGRPFLKNTGSEEIPSAAPTGQYRSSDSDQMNLSSSNHTASLADGSKSYPDKSHAHSALRFFGKSSRNDASEDLHESASPHRAINKAQSAYYFGRSDRGEEKEVESQSICPSINRSTVNLKTSGARQPNSNIASTIGSSSHQKATGTTSNSFNHISIGEEYCSASERYQDEKPIKVVQTDMRAMNKYAWPQTSDHQNSFEGCSSTMDTVRVSSLEKCSEEGEFDYVMRRPDNSKPLVTFAAGKYRLKDGALGVQDEYDLAQGDDDDLQAIMSWQLQQLDTPKKRVPTSSTSVSNTGLMIPTRAGVEEECKGSVLIPEFDIKFISSQNMDQSNMSESFDSESNFPAFAACGTEEPALENDELFLQNKSNRLRQTKYVDEEESNQAFNRALGREMFSFSYGQNDHIEGGSEFPGAYDVFLKSEDEDDQVVLPTSQGNSFDDVIRVGFHDDDRPLPRCRVLTTEPEYEVASGTRDAGLRNSTDIKQSSPITDMSTAIEQHTGMFISNKCLGDSTNRAINFESSGHEVKGNLTRPWQQNDYKDDEKFAHPAEKNGKDVDELDTAVLCRKSSIFGTSLDEENGKLQTISKRQLSYDEPTSGTPREDEESRRKSVAQSRKNCAIKESVFNSKEGKRSLKVGASCQHGAEVACESNTVPNVATEDVNPNLSSTKEKPYPRNREVKPANKNGNITQQISKTASTNSLGVEIAVKVGDSV